MHTAQHSTAKRSTTIYILWQRDVILNIISDISFHVLNVRRKSIFITDVSLFCIPLFCVPLFCWGFFLGHIHLKLFDIPRSNCVLKARVCVPFSLRKKCIYALGEKKQSINTDRESDRETEKDKLGKRHK